MITAVPESAVRYWSTIMADRFFDSEQDARNEVFRICEHHSRQSWSTPEGKNTVPENRAFADALPLYREGDQWKVGRSVQEDIKVTPEIIRMARTFLIQKWKDRAVELGRPEPDDLTGACKFASLFAQALFGGKLKGNWHHQYVLLPNGEKIDLVGGMTRDRVDYTHDPEFWNNPEHVESMKSCAPRVKTWTNEFKRKLGLQEYLTMTPDFSDGTNGEPTAYPPSSGDAGTAVGLPDYKYLERKKRRHEKLRALLQRRNPGGPTGVQESIVAYHASPYRFKTFDTRKEGAHFGTKEQAYNLRKAGKREPKAYYLDIENPLRMRDIGVWNNFNNLHGALSIEGLITDEQAEAAWAAWLRSDDEGWETLKQALKLNGYDGIVYQNEQEGEGDSYIALWPDQIRPADNLREQRLSAEEMAILKKQTRPRRRLFRHSKLKMVR